MKRIGFAITAVVMLLTSAVADHHKEKPWLDLQGCSICKHMGKHMDMMEHVTWETYKIENGMLSASVIPNDYRARMDEINEKMMAVAAKLEQGEEMPLCGFCSSYGELKMAGANSEQIKTGFGMIELFTSDDPAVVKKIHKHADRTVKEFAAYKAAAANQ